MRDLLLTVVILGMLPWALARAHVGVYLWYWIGLMNPHKLAYGFAVTFPFAQVIAVTTLLALVFGKDRKPILWNSSLVLMSLLFGYMTMTTFFAWAPNEAWDYWGKVGKVLLMTYVMILLIHGRKKIHTLLIIVALSIGFYGVKGGIFSILTGGGNKVWGPSGGTFISDNNFLGLAMVMVVPLMVVLAREEPRRWLRIGLHAAAFLTIISIIFTYSRGALLGLLVVLPLLYMRSKQKVWVAILIVPLLLVGKEYMPAKYFERAETIGTYQEDNSAMQRVRSWNVSWGIAKDRPFLGAGFEFETPENKKRWFTYVPDEYLQYGDTAHVAHSSYFQVLGQHGFIALALYLSVLILVQYRLQKLKSEFGASEENRWIATTASAIQIAVFGYIVSGAFLNAAYFDVLYLYVALVSVLQREANFLKRDDAQSAGASNVSHRQHRPVGAGS